MRCAATRCTASRPAPIRLPRRSGDLPPAALDSWLTALGAKSPVVAADPNELAKLEQLVGEWRADAAARGGSFRLCLRLREPRDDGATDDVLADGGPAARDAGPTRPAGRRGDVGVGVPPPGHRRPEPGRRGRGGLAGRPATPAGQPVAQRAP